VKALKWLFMRHSPLVVRPGLDSDMWRWMFQMLMNCTESRYETN
jgi:D-amino-acid dehydrogenase